MPSQLIKSTGPEPSRPTSLKLRRASEASADTKALADKPAGKCCEPFNPEPWQDPSTGSGQVKEITWSDKLFVKDHVVSFLHTPLNMGKKIVKNMALIENAGTTK